MSFLVKKVGEEFHLYVADSFVKVLNLTDAIAVTSCIDIITQGCLFCYPHKCEV